MTTGKDCSKEKIKSDKRLKTTRSSALSVGQWARLRDVPGAQPASSLHAGAPPHSHSRTGYRHSHSPALGPLRHPPRLLQSSSGSSQVSGLTGRPPLRGRTARAIPKRRLAPLSASRPPCGPEFAVTSRPRRQEARGAAAGGKAPRPRTPAASAAQRARAQAEEGAEEEGARRRPEQSTGRAGGEDAAAPARVRGFRGREDGLGGGGSSAGGRERGGRGDALPRRLLALGYLDSVADSPPLPRSGLGWRGRGRAAAAARRDSFGRPEAQATRPCGAPRRWSKVLVAARETLVAAALSQHDQVSPQAAPVRPPVPFPLAAPG
ncbi:PREDICTED: myristoylated alanine-rich C-kinase substrate-like [Chrysochloris asiatica]|uniref:Myristoylated alanine-rich C-kinase substrate-like n=1 Tax=Chrysochloris asiatica TaxID=185453 RepID=A0A9B0TJW7_CHRAS|nr:PREDICTED: myristoylated alanine-rich C-kinase substrate-like [Chrysochloris asiatica]